MTDTGTGTARRAPTGDLPADYETLDDLTDRARQLGAKRVTALGVEWESGVGSTYQARATLVTSDGEVFEADGWATPGDGQDEDPRPADNDPFVRQRARARALRAVLRMAYGRDADATQPPHVKQAHMVIRKAAEAMGSDASRLREKVHEKWGVASVNDLTQQQAHEVCEWFRDWVTGEE